MHKHRFFLKYADIAAVLCLAVVPDVVNSLYSFTRTGATGSYPFVYIHASLITRSLQVSAVILFIMVLRRVDWDQFGFKPLRPGRDISIGVALIMSGYAMCMLAYGVISLIHTPEPEESVAVKAMVAGMSPTSAFAFLVMIASSLANGFAEELAMRSYLITRISQVSRSSWLAVFITSVLFGVYHLYQGVTGALFAMAIGTVFGVYFVAKRRFWPIAIAHAAMDIIPQLAYLAQSPPLPG